MPPSSAAVRLLAGMTIHRASVPEHSTFACQEVQSSQRRQRRPTAPVMISAQRERTMETESARVPSDLSVSRDKTVRRCHTDAV